MFRVSRPPVRLTLALASILFATAVLGIGLLRAATYKPTPAAGAPWPSGTSAAQ